MAAAATTGLQRPLPAQAGGAAQPLAQQQQQQQQDFDSAQRLSQAFAQYQQEQQVAALLQQANNGMGGGSFAGSLSLAHALAASGLLGGLPGLGPHQPAPLASLPGLAGMGQLQGLGGGLGAQAGLGGLDPLGLHALQQMQQASQGLGLGLGQLQALQSLGALGSLPGGLGSLPGGASFGAQPQLGLGSLQAPVPPQQQQQQVAVALGPGYGMQQGGVVRGAEQLDRELLQQLQQLNDAHLARSHPPHGPAPPTAATRDASAAPLPLQQPAPPPIQQDTAAEVAVRQRQLEFEALLYQQQQQQQQQQAGAAPLQQPAPPPAAEGSRPQRRRLPSGKAAATEAPQFAAAKAPSAMLPRTATATLALSAGGPPPLLQQPSVASICLQQPSTGRGVRSGSAGADFDSGEEGAEGMGGDGRLAEARRKNREAQQRFRERQRAAAREAEAKYQEMLDQVCQLRLENAELAQRNYYMSAALAVRDSMLQAFKLGQRGSTPSHSVGAPPEQPQPPSQPAGAQPPGQPQGEEARDGSSAMASGAEAAKASADAAAAAASNVAPSGGGSPALAAAGEAGGAASGSGVRSSRGQSSTEIEEVQPASRGALGDPVSLTTARLMRSPDDLCTYYRQAQVEMRFALQVYLENGRAEEDRAAVEAAHQLMQDVWAHTMALFPDGVKNFIHDLSCPDGLDAERWEALAAKLVFSDDSLQILFTGYRRYLKQNARIARERQHLQQQLARLLEVAQEAALIPAEDWALGMHMQAQAAALVEALDVAQGLNHLGDLEFHSRMDFCIPWCTSVGQFQMALVNAESTPYIPQFLELARRVLRLAAESGRLVGSNGSLLTLGEVEDVAGDGGVSRHMRVEIEEQEEEVEEKLQHEGHEEQQAHQKTAIKEEPATNGAELHAASVDGADKAASAVDGQSTVPVAAPAAS